MPDDEKNFVAYSKKAIRWLYAMSEHSVASRRAWQLCDISLRRLASGMKFDVTDMPTTTYQNAPSSTLDLTDPGQHPGQDLNTERPGSLRMDSAGYWGPHFEDLTLTGQPQIFPTDHFHNGYAEMPSSDPMSQFTIEGSVADDLYFPYDPISGEFISSFFPNGNEEESTWG